MPTFLLLLLGLTAVCVSQDSSEGSPAVVASPNNKGMKRRTKRKLLKNRTDDIKWGGPGDPCEDHKCNPIHHTICNNKTNTCSCNKRYPVLIIHKTHHCIKPARLGSPCEYDDQCQYHVDHSSCRETYTNYSECQCIRHYEERTIRGYAVPTQCFPDLESLKADVPTLLGMGLGLSMLSALICLVLKIFSRERFARPRRYADARINPPLTVSETYAAFALAAHNSAVNSPARHSSLRSTKSASSSRRPSYASLQALRPASRRPSQASLQLVVGKGRGEPIGYYVCIRDPGASSSRGGSRRPSQSSMASSSGDLRDGSGSGRVHHYLYMRAANYSLASDTTNTTTGGTSDSSPRTPKSTEQLLAVYHPGPEMIVFNLEEAGRSEGHPIRGSHTTSTLGSSSDDVFKEEDEDEEEEEEERRRKEEEEEEDESEEAKARLIV